MAVVLMDEIVSSIAGRVPGTLEEAERVLGNCDCCCCCCWKTGGGIAGTLNSVVWC